MWQNLASAIIGGTYARRGLPTILVFVLLALFLFLASFAGWMVYEAFLWRRSAGITLAVAFAVLLIWLAYSTL